MEKDNMERITANEISRTVNLLEEVLEPLFKTKGLYAVKANYHNDYCWTGELSKKNPVIGIDFFIKDEEKEKELHKIIGNFPFCFSLYFENYNLLNTYVFLKSIKEQLDEKFKSFSLNKLMIKACQNMNYKTFDELADERLEELEHYDDGKENCKDQYCMDILYNYLGNFEKFYKKEIKSVKKSTMAVVDYLIKLNNDKEVLKEAQEQENKDDQR